jgi:hypothetical protein
VTKQLLDGSQIRTSFEDMCGSRVAKAVWSHSWNPVNPLCRNGYRPARRPLIKPSATGSEKEGVVTLRRRENRPTVCQPKLERDLGGSTKWHHPLLVTLAQHLDCSSAEFDIVQVQSTELTDSHRCRVEDLKDRRIAKMHRRLLRVRLGIPGQSRLSCGQHLFDLIYAQYDWKLTWDLW